MEKEKTARFKKLKDICVNVLVVLIFIAAIIAVASAISQKKSGVPGVFGYTVNSVASDSMSGVFEVGDLVIGKTYDKKTKLDVDTIITFWDVDSIGRKFLNTHKIIEVIENENGIYYVTKGENELEKDSRLRTTADIVSVYQSKLTGVGKVIDWLKTPVGFIICLVLPILAFIIIQVYKIVVIVAENNRKTVAVASAAEASDDVKDAIIREYLEKKKREELEGGASDKSSTEEN